MTNRLLTLQTPVSASEKVETIQQTFPRGRIRVVVVEKTPVAERAWTQATPVDPGAAVKSAAREPAKQKKSLLSPLQRKLQQKKAAKIARTLKLIEKRREQKRAKAARSPKPQVPQPKMGKAKRRAISFAQREAQKDRVAQLARSVLNAAVASLPGLTKANEELAWLNHLDVVHWGESDRRRVEFLRQVLKSIIAGTTPATIEKPDGGFFRWPSTEVGIGPGVSQMETPIEEIGVLSSVGYRVGKRGLSVAERRAILGRVYERELNLPLPANYLSEWGNPRTARRLQKMANTIAALTRARKRQAKDSSAAIDDWESDLAFLKQRYYVGRYDFPWPRYE
jgi:hypothetical protein